MVNNLIQFLSKYADLTDDQVQIFKDENLIRVYPKGTTLVREGQLAKNCYFVLDGCIRSYYITNGEEQNTEFFSENDLIIPVSYIKNAPSAYFIECLEDCILTIGSAEKTEKFLTAHPEFSPMFQKINEDLLATRQVAWDSFHNLTPEEHYLEIVKQKPELIKRLPQYHIASYLGIKPQSLSRIRKRVAKALRS